MATAIGGIQNHNEVLESRVFEGEHGIDGVRTMRGLQWMGIFTRSEEKMRNSEYQSRDPREEHEQGGTGEQSIQAGDEEKKKGARKALFKRMTAIAVGTSRMRFVQAVLPPRKNDPAKPGKGRGEGDGARQTEDKGPLNPKLSSSKPFKTQEVLWWGWGVGGEILVFGWFSGFLESENGSWKELADVVSGLIKPKTATSRISWIWTWRSSASSGI
ncbi:hypothetical protein IGI04_023367 [Brassica rapa subsp. trilocularis]|uniref:Uncharacterized protein n=1 Tax=Brassica rapa subsp. trilocularis TaxID=1813537 RepID=A0ABQ7M720_BRACM|nr:hypothetical protein IGI04_023367 [Brassica rapa subsp. trilocularis]